MYDGETRYGTQVSYNGNYYDSETEAEWAAYFDAAGMPFVHEPETFLLPNSNGTLYTPDYFLPDQDVYAEIKNGNIGWGECYKVATLARSIGRTVLLINGKPRHMTVYFFSPDSTKIASASRSFPQNEYSDLALQAYQTRVSNASEAALPYAELITKYSRQAQETKFYTPTEAQIIAHSAKKAELRTRLHRL